MVATLIAISIIIFVIIQLPPRLFLDLHRRAAEPGEAVDLQKIAFLKAQYGFDKPVWEQYLYWVGGAAAGARRKLPSRGLYVWSLQRTVRRRADAIEGDDRPSRRSSRTATP